MAARQQCVGERPVRDVAGQGQLDRHVQAGQKAGEEAGGASVGTTKTHHGLSGSEPRAVFRSAGWLLPNQASELFTEVNQPRVNHLVAHHLAGWKNPIRTSLYSTLIGPGL